MKSFLIILLDSILPKGLGTSIPIGCHSNNHFSSPFPFSSRSIQVGHLGHHFPDKVAIEKVRSPSLYCVGVSSRSPPILKKLWQWDCDISQTLELRSNFALVFPRLVPHRINLTPLSEKSFFDPFPFLVWVKIIIGC